MSPSIAQQKAWARANFIEKELPPWAGVLQAMYLVADVRSFNACTLDAPDLNKLQEAINLLCSDIAARAAAAPKVDEEETAA
jgi:hypothetical protein